MKARVMIAAAASGSGKTIISCGLMQALKNSGYKVVSGKCGPDYIDPMFHREVLGIDSQNLDLFFCQEPILKSLFAKHVKNSDIAVLEGVMGYYDGMMLGSDLASSYDLAKKLQTPVILVVPCKGMALSVLAMLKGMIEFRKDSNIQGILLNRMSSMLYSKVKQMIEAGLQEMGHSIPVLGYIPESEVFGLQSRHLGLVTPTEIEGLKQQIEAAGMLLKETVEIDRIIDIARKAPQLPVQELPREEVRQPTVKVGIARDKAFGFYYKDNLELLKQLGCELIEFSPLTDKELPEGIGGMILGGGYPEYYAKELSANIKLRKSIKAALDADMPCLAECGGFMYLHEKLEGTEGESFEMIGVIPGEVIRTARLVRFGYINISGIKDGVYIRAEEQLRGHEFHYWDSNNNGSDCIAEKPNGSTSWDCIHMKGNMFAGFPHLHYYSNPGFAKRFVDQVRKYVYGKRD